MSPRSSQILSEALALSSAERAELIDLLLHSLAPPQDYALMERWRTEAESRIDAHESGRLSADTAEAVFDRLNKR